MEAQTVKYINKVLGSFKKRNLKRGYFLMLLNAIVTGVLPVITIFVPRIVIDSLMKSEITQKSVIVEIIVVVGIALACGSVSAFLANYYGSVAIKVRMEEWIEVVSINSRFDYWQLEDKKFRDDLELNMMALGNDSDGFEGLLRDSYNLLPHILTVILLCIVICFFNPLICLACFLGVVVAIIAKSFMSRFELKQKDKKANALRKLEYFENTCYDFSYGKDVRLYNLRGKLDNDYKKAAANYINVIKLIANRKFLLGIYELVMLLLQDSLAYFLIIFSYYHNSLSLGEVSLYIGAVIALSTSLRTISDFLKKMITDAGYCKNYYEFLSNPNLFGQTGDNKALPINETLEIEFKNVSFKYPNTERYIIKNFSFKINKGEKLAIVGINGAGKSTLVKLITGLFKVTEGEILVNGIPLNSFDYLEYQKMFSAVFQDVYIYPGSIIENICGIDKSLEARNKAIDALTRVGLHDKIMSLPKGYDTSLLKVIDENGVELSGGQNQKIAIARALYKNGNMIILDEPTSALDALAEADIYQSFDDLVENKTAIYISHRLSSTKFCDKIALFSGDGLLEYGSHDELMQLKGEYYHMFETQGKYYQEENNDEN